MAGLTQAQQDTINRLQAAVTNANVDYQNSLAAYSNAFNSAQECQNKRDQYSTGTKKNQACHIDTLSSLNSASNAAGRDRDAKEQILSTAKIALDNYMKTLEGTVAAETGLNAAGLAGDANYQLTQQANILAAQQAALAAQLQQETNQSQSKLDAERSKKINTIILWSVVAVVGLVLIIGGVYAYKKFSKPEDKKD